MIHKPFELIDKEDVLALVSNQIPEGRMLEYKEQLPGDSDGERKEFLVDVSSFANAAGGDILYGVPELRDQDRKATGTPASAIGLADINADQVIGRLENMARDGIAPRISGIRMKPILGFSKGPVILIRIPKSWAAPHMVTLKSDSRFHSRNSRGKYPLDVTEIRSAFALSEALPDRIRRFRDERIARIVADETPVPLLPNPKTVLHILPIAALDPTTRLDVVAAKDRVQSLHPMCGGPFALRYNFDGLLSVANSRNESPTCPAYAQLFRSGAIEAVEALMLALHSHDKSVPADLFEQRLVSDLVDYLKFEQDLGVEPPIFVMLSLLGVRDYTIQTRYRYYETENLPIDRDVLLLPDILVDDYAARGEDLLRPAFDALWQSAGWAGSKNYKDDGTWTFRTVDENVRSR